MPVSAGESSGEESGGRYPKLFQDCGHAWGPPAHLKIEVDQQLFESCISGRRFSSWQEFIQAVAGRARQPLALQESTRGSVVRLDPMQVFAWVATFMIEVCLWGLVGWAAATHVWVGIAASALFTVALYLAASWPLAPQLSGMIWPNVPCAIAATGTLVAFRICQAGDGSYSSAFSAVQPAWILGLSILPQTLAAALLMLALPRDPDRASLVTNLFLGIYAAVEALFAIVRSQSSPDGPTDSEWYFFSVGSLLVLSLATVATAWHLYHVPSAFGSVELISWTLNVGCLALFVSISFMLSVPWTNSSANWCLYFLISPAFGLIGRYLGRSFPMLLSALSLCTVGIRASVEVGFQTDSVLFGLCTFGLLGIAVVIGVQLVFGYREGRSERGLLA